MHSDMYQKRKTETLLNKYWNRSIASFFSVLRKPHNKKKPTNKQTKKKEQSQTKAKEQISIESDQEIQRLYRFMNVCAWFCLYVCAHTFSVVRVSPVRSMQDHQVQVSSSSILSMHIYISLSVCMYVEAINEWNEDTTNDFSEFPCSKAPNFGPNQQKLYIYKYQFHHIYSCCSQTKSIFHHHPNLSRPTEWHTSNAF